MSDDSYDKQELNEIAALRATFARLDPLALAIATGVVCGALLAAATSILVLAGSPDGMHVGPHLNLLAHFLPGYRVSFPGAAVGLGYGFVIGAFLGLFMAAMWNITHFIYALKVAARSLFDRSID